jgi:dihydroorotase
MVASDGGRDLNDNPTHPRASGAFGRVLGHYVREAKVMELHDAIRRMTLAPAQRLETRVPEMRDRGRIRVGAFADIAIFDPSTIIDRSTYTDAARFTDGVAHVLVNGIPVVRSGLFAERATLIDSQPVLVGTPMPGRPIRAPRR